jgi:hypothetical protein
MIVYGYEVNGNNEYCYYLCGSRISIGVKITKAFEAKYTSKRYTDKEKDFFKRKVHDVYANEVVWVEMPNVPIGEESIHRKEDEHHS